MLYNDCYVAGSWRPFRAPIKYRNETQGVALGYYPSALAAPKPLDLEMQSSRPTGRSISKSRNVRVPGTEHLAFELVLDLGDDLGGDVRVDLRVDLALGRARWAHSCSLGAACANPSNVAGNPPRLRQFLVLTSAGRSAMICQRQVSGISEQDAVPACRIRHAAVLQIFTNLGYWF
jgi:hypothetical protein